MTESDKTNDLGSWRSELRAALAALPSDLQAFVPLMQEIRSAVHAELAAAMEPRLNEHLRSRPQWSYDDKRELASWTNRILRESGLAIREPGTGRATRLLANYKHDGARESRFQLEGTGEDGRVSRSCISSPLSRLELRQAPAREEGAARPRRVSRPRS